MKSPICHMLAVEFPLFAFSHTRDVVVEVSKAGGFGVLGAVGHTPDPLPMPLQGVIARTVAFDFTEDFATAVEHLGGILDE